MQYKFKHAVNTVLTRSALRAYALCSARSRSAVRLLTQRAVIPLALHGCAYAQVLRTLNLREATLPHRQPALVIFIRY